MQDSFLLLSQEGLNLKVVSEAISNVKASGVAIDIGIRYATGGK